MLRAIDITLSYFFVYYGVYVYVYLIVTSLFFGAYLFQMGYSRWFLGFIPFVNNFAKWGAGQVPLLLVIPTTLIVILNVVTGSTLFSLLPMLILVIVTDFIFARNYVSDGNPFVYALVPLAKYFIMVKEMRSWSNITKETNTKKKTTTK